MLLGLVLSVSGLVLLVSATLRLAMFALPLGLGVAMLLWASDHDMGLLVGLVLGVLVGAAAFLAGRLALLSPLPWPVRAGIALLFAVPAGMAGHSIVAGLMHLGGAGPTATLIVSLSGAALVAIAAIPRLLPGLSDPVSPEGTVLCPRTDDMSD